MERTDNDSWNLATSVGATATMVAAQRALASSKDNSLIDDPFAEPLVRAVGIDFFTRMATWDFTQDELATMEQLGFSADTASDGMAARTKFFDSCFLSAAQAGIRQAVILASGLDTRAYRLTWPQDMVVYEIDQPEVIAFKTEKLAQLGAHPSAARTTVAIDLREEWPAALIAAGFDPAAPSAWSAEGLLIYLPGDAQDRLFESITGLSAPGSRLGCDEVPELSSVDFSKAREITKQFTDESFELDMENLVYRGSRQLPTAWLNSHGWSATATTGDELHAEFGLPPVNPKLRTVFPEVSYVSATLG